MCVVAVAVDTGSRTGGCLTGVSVVFCKSIYFANAGTKTQFLDLTETINASLEESRLSDLRDYCRTSPYRVVVKSRITAFSDGMPDRRRCDVDDRNVLPMAVL